MGTGFYRITSWDEAAHRWDRELVTNNDADNVCGTIAAAEHQIETLRGYGEDWASAQYDVEEIPAADLEWIASSEYGAQAIARAEKDR